jgi:hypothetical protein
MCFTYILHVYSLHDSCEHGNEPLGFVKGWEYLAFISDCYRIEEGSPYSCQISEVQRNSL